MPYEWAETTENVDWQRPVRMQLQQNGGESGFGLRIDVDPSTLNANDNTDESYRTILDSIIAAVEAHGFTLVSAYRDNQVTWQLVSGPEV